jgi:hypothetical protein
VAAGNFVDMMGIKQIVTFQKETDGNVFWTLIGAYMLGLIYMIIAVVVLTTMLMILVMRLVMIWIYVVLSPLAYLLSAFPGGAQYASKWWKDFISNLIVGPILAFFIWLSFAALQTSEDINKFRGAIEDEGNIVSSTSEKQDLNSGNMVTEASNPNVFIKFIVGIGMLIGGLKIAQEVGGAAGSIAGKGMSKLNTMGAATVGGIGGFALGRAKWAGRQLGDARDIASEKLGVDLNVAAGYKRWSAQSEANRQDRKDRIRAKTLTTAEDPNASYVHRKMALLSTGDAAWQNFLDHKLIRGGSPKKMKNYSQQLKEKDDENDAIEEDINVLEQDNATVITKDEYKQRKKRANNIYKKKTETEDEIASIRDQDFISLESKEKNGSITKDEQNTLNDKRKQIETKEGEINNYQQEIDSLTARPIDKDDHENNQKKIAKLIEDRSGVRKEVSELKSNKEFIALQEKESKGTIKDSEKVN